MNQIISTPGRYSELWGKESELLEAHGVYEQLAKITPEGNVLDLVVALEMAPATLPLGAMCCQLKAIHI